VGRPGRNSSENVSYPRTRDLLHEVNLLGDVRAPGRWRDAHCRPARLDRSREPDACQQRCNRLGWYRVAEQAGDPVDAQCERWAALVTFVDVDRRAVDLAAGDGRQ
jgi:hypothetical protein